MAHTITEILKYRTTFFLSLKNFSAKKAPMGCEMIGVIAAIPARPKRCLIRIILRVVFVKIFFLIFLFSLYACIHFKITALKLVKMTFPVIPPAQETKITLMKLYLNTITAVGKPSFTKKKVQVIKTENIFKNSAKVLGKLTHWGDVKQIINANYCYITKGF